jgi:hypothetical protein
MEDIFYKLVYKDREIYVREEHLVRILKTRNIPNEIIRVPKSEGSAMIRQEKINQILGEE